MRNVWSRGVIAAAVLAVALVGICLGVRSRREEGERHVAEAAAGLSRRLEALEKGRAALESRIVPLEKGMGGLAGEARRRRWIGEGGKREDEAGWLAGGKGLRAGGPASAAGVGGSAAAPRPRRSTACSGYSSI